jgi:hypothetical protein
VGRDQANVKKRRSAGQHSGNDRGRIAHLNENVKCFTAKSRKSGLNGSFGGSNDGSWKTSRLPARKEIELLRRNLFHNETYG